MSIDYTTFIQRNPIRQYGTDYNNWFSSECDQSKTDEHPQVYDAGELMNEYTKKYNQDHIRYV